MGGRSEWKLGVGGQGAVVAVVQGAALEVRAKKDDFASIVGRNTSCELVVHIVPKRSWKWEPGITGTLISDNGLVDWHSLEDNISFQSTHSLG